MKMYIISNGRMWIGKSGLISAAASCEHRPMADNIEPKQQWKPEKINRRIL